MGKTLIDYFEKFTPAQQNHIVHLMQTIGERPDFHRGLIPFLDANTAYKVIKQFLISIGIGYNERNVRFNRKIISIFINAVDRNKLMIESYQTSVILKLNNQKISKKFKIKSKQIFVNISDYFITWKHRRCYVELFHLTKNEWQITTSTRQINQVVSLFNEFLR